MCGSSSLNRDFLAILPDLIGQVLNDIPQDMGISKEEFLTSAVTSFEDQKKRFDGHAKWQGDVHLYLKGMKIYTSCNATRVQNRLILSRYYQPLFLTRLLLSIFKLSFSILGMK